MATFQVQIEDLTGSVSDTAALSSWLTDGARSVLNILPVNKLDRIASNENFTDSIDVESKKILTVVRKDASNSNLYMPCRQLSASFMGRVLDSSYMEYASTTDPAYIVHNDVLNTYPQSVASSDSRVVFINAGITVAFGDSAIANFPDEAENAVVLYAARNSLQRLMNDIQTNSDITTTLTAVNTELDETQAVCDLINTQVDAAVVEIAETVTNIDDNVDTALGLMNTSADKINAAIELANAEFDKSNALLSLGEADTEGAVNTALAAVVTELGELPGIADNIHSEVQLINTQADLALIEIGLANTEVDKMAAETGLDNAELDLAKIELAEAAVIVDATVDAVLANVNQAADKCAAAVVFANTQFDSAVTANTAEDIELAASHVNAGSGFIGEANAGLTEAQAYSQEAQAALSQVQNQVNVAQGYIQNGAGYSRVADGYAKAAQGFLGTAQNYLTAGQGFASTAQGYSSEIQAKLGIASGYGNEVSARLAQAQAKRQESQSRLAAGNAFLQEATIRASEVNSYGTEVQQRLAQVGAQGNVAASYIATAQGYAGEIQSKIGIASGYLQEMQGRLAVDNSKYTWYTQQYQMIDAQYKEQIQTLQGAL